MSGSSSGVRARAFSCSESYLELFSGATRVAHPTARTTGHPYIGGNLYASPVHPAAFGCHVTSLSSLVSTSPELAIFVIFDNFHNSFFHGPAAAVGAAPTQTNARTPPIVWSAPCSLYLHDHRKKRRNKQYDDPQITPRLTACRSARRARSACRAGSPTSTSCRRARRRRCSLRWETSRTCGTRLACAACRRQAPSSRSWAWPCAGCSTGCTWRRTCRCPVAAAAVAGLVALVLRHAGQHARV